jgi:single-stranded DNA-binding protein
MSGIEAAFLGTLSRDSEAKTSKSGKVYLRLNVRVGDNEAAQWINVSLFGDCATDLMSTALLKGQAIYCEGRLSLDRWEAANGEKRAGLSCMSWFARPCAIGERKPKRERSSKSKPDGQAARPNDFHNDDIGF